MSLFGRTSPKVEFQEDEHDQFLAFPSAQASASESHEDENEIGLEGVASPLLLGEDRLADFTTDDESQSELSSDTDHDCDVNHSEQKQYLKKDTSKANRWLRHTANERAIAEGLQLVDATDLTRHLLNSHGVSARQYQTAAAAEKPLVPRRDWVEGWMPGKSWTSWPKKPDHVPRRQEQIWADSLVKEGDWMPSKDLEEAVFALMLRKAREQWDKRESASPIDRSEGQEVNDSSDGAPDVAKISEAAKSASVSVPQKRTHHELDEPVFCADDDIQWRVLGPSVKSTLSKLDGLLIALHQSKVGSRIARRHATGTGSSNKSRKDRSRGQSKELEKNLSTDARSPGPIATDTEAMDSSTSNSESDDTEPLDSETAEHRRKHFNYELQREAPRDWSEILGFASILGIPPEIISRTATRCAAAFNEGVSFRPMKENDTTSKLPEQVNFLPEDLLNIPSSDYKLGDTGEIRSTTEVITWDLDADRKCPMPGCNWEVSEQYLKQHLEQDSKRSINWSRKRLREHLKRTHKLEDPDSNAMEMLKTKHGAVHIDGFMVPIQGQKGWRGRDRSKSQSQNRGGSRPGAGRKPTTMPAPRRNRHVPNDENDSEDMVMVDMVDPALK